MRARGSTLLLLALLALASAVRAQPRGYALIVTNNRSRSSSRPDLHYADDDGVQYAQLFRELLGEDRVSLLTQLDAETAAMHPLVHAEPPTHARLRSSVQRLSAQLRAARAAGEPATLYLVFAGHGDIDRGQGYLDLEDGRLSARELDEDVISQLPAARIHLILDSCNSYFLLNPRKPGGKRWRSEDGTTRDLLSKYPQLGAVLSTSAEAVTYEWSELQSGVFSYEVRSGLRGSADVNNDNRITYAELSAFLRVANRPVLNDLYRPKVFARAPAADHASGEAELVRLPGTSARRLMLGSERTRLTVRDARGVRLLDIHKEAGTSGSLLLPAHGALAAEQVLAGTERPEVFERALPEGEAELQLSALAPAPLRERTRGEPPLFSALFAEPFGREAFERIQREPRVEEEAPSGVTEHDVERLRLHLSLIADDAAESRVDTGFGLLITSTVPTAMLSYSLYRDARHTHDWVDRTGFGAGVITSAITLGIATYFLSASWSEESLLDDFRAADFSSERARSRNVPRFEHALSDTAAASRSARHTWAWWLLIGGAFSTIQGGYMLGQDAVNHDSLRLAGPFALLVGIGELAFSGYFFGTASTVERIWQTYSRDPAVLRRGLE